MTIGSKKWKNFRQHQGVCKGCPDTPLGEKMAGGEYRAEK